MGTKIIRLPKHYISKYLINLSVIYPGPLVPLVMGLSQHNNEVLWRLKLSSLPN